LTTKDQGVIFERTMKTYPHPKARIRSRFIFLEIASYKRCSRPLCSSQTTTPYHTPRTPAPQRDRNAHDRCSQETRNKPKPGKPGPVASGPNSVPNTTQQPPTGPRSRTPRPPKRRDIRTCCRQLPPGTYPLIFHP
jgi:hypothetical protein